MFQVIYEISELRYTLHNFYEVSRILTKHCANYEAQKLMKLVADLEKDCLDESLSQCKLLNVLQVQTVVLKNVMNFLIGLMKEYKDILEEDSLEGKKQCQSMLSAIPKNVSVLGHVIYLLKKYQLKHYENTWKNEELEDGLAYLENFLRVGHLNTSQWVSDVVKLMHLHNTVLRVAVWHVKFGVKIRCHNDNIECQSGH